MKKIYSVLLIGSLGLCHQQNNDQTPLVPQKKQIDEKTTKAILSCQKELAIHPGNTEAHFLLGNLWAECDEFEKALEEYAIVLSQNPNRSAALYTSGFVLRSMGNFTKALQMYDAYLSKHPDNRDGRQGRSHALLALGELQKAWPDFECRWAEQRPDSLAFTNYLRNNPNLAGKTVLLKGELGLGDMFQFIRYAEKVKNSGAKVIVKIKKQLVKIFSLCPYIDQVIDEQTPAPPHELSTVIMSLPWAFETNLDTIPNTTPYLKADTALVKLWRSRLADDNAFKIGLCWHGNLYEGAYAKQLVADKSIPLRLLAPLASIGQIQFYSLQKTSGLDELKSLPDGFIVNTFNQELDETHGAFMDTAAIMKNLDLVITIDTSIAHLAGGLGVPVWTLLPAIADWRWLTQREDSPWYPTMRLFRQPKKGDWDSVVTKVKEALQKILAHKIGQ